MKVITVYEANDGSRWDDDVRALERDVLIAECEAAVARIGLRTVPSDTDFANGGGFVKQPDCARSKLWDFLNSRGVNRDSSGPIGLLLCRYQKIDKHDREWGQPYYALNPHQGTQVEASP